MKRIIILGSTGSIGIQALDIIRHHPNEFKIIAITCQKNLSKLQEQIDEFQPEAIGISYPSQREKITAKCPIFFGEEGLREIAQLPCDLLINSLVGTAGLIPTVEAIKKGTTIALANKETLVLAGEIVMHTAKKYKVEILPIDSEHSALFQSLKSGRKNEIHNLILTMGKGKIAEMNESQLAEVTLADIFSRPAWNMGQKVTIDSATCMNKSFEIIEAKWLFDVAPDQIKVIVHPDYICHSLVEFIDGSIITEFGTADMRRYTQYALFHPTRPPAPRSLFTDLYGKTLRFEKPPYEKFPCLSMGHYVLQEGGIMAAVMHGADHAAVEAFIEKKISFIEIPKYIEQTLHKIKNILNPDIHQVIEAEKEGYRKTKELIGL